MIRLTCSNNVHGNPNRVFVLLNERGQVVSFWEEEYYGIKAVPEKYRDLANNCITIPTTEEFLKNLRRDFHQKFRNEESTTQGDKTMQSNKIIEVENGDGNRFKIGDEVGHQDKKVGRAVIQSFKPSETHPPELVAFTDKGWAHIDFLEK